MSAQNMLKIIIFQNTLKILSASKTIFMPWVILQNVLCFSLKKNSYKKRKLIMCLLYKENGNKYKMFGEPRINKY